MNKLRKNVFLLMVGTCWVLFIQSSCSKENIYPIEPVLTYTGFVYPEASEKGVLVLGFTDGDGDIGLSQEDTLPPYHSGGGNYHNFFIELYTKEDGIYRKVTFPDTTFTFNSRIPRIILDGKSKAIKGELEYTFDLSIMRPFLQSDTIRIEAQIVDRALHQSNMVQTPDIPID